MAWNTTGVVFDVISEDSRRVNRLLFVTSKRLMRSLKPVMEEGEERGKSTVDVTITRRGSGLHTTYAVVCHG